MANYYGTARSNYFKVKDSEAFEAWAESIPSLGVWDTSDGMFGIFNQGGGWPCARYQAAADVNGQDEDDLGEDLVEFDLLAELAAHLEEGQVAILMEAGAEKLRYIIGCAHAVNWKGEVLQISLYDIYDAVHKEWGIDPTLAEY